MPVHPSWSDLAIRLACAMGSGILIGFDRGHHGRPAGLRTTMFVSLAACVAMMQANILMFSPGKTPDSFAVIDIGRWPLGILSGMGFIGAGAILRRGSLVIGLTTAATLWLVTVLGLCFGGGQIALGLSGCALTLAGLKGLKSVERRMQQDREGTLTIVAGADGPTEEGIRAAVYEQNCTIASTALAFCPNQQSREMICRIRWRETSDERVPGFVRELSRSPGVERIAWTPRN